jgi:GntR family transcriptional regulator
MRIRISTSSGVPVYLQIVNQVKYQIAAGGLSTGEQLPSVRKLAETLLINPNTVARAYRELEAAGMIATRRGSGVYISAEGSPLARGHKIRILNEHIDTLLTEAFQLGLTLEEVARRLQERAALLQNADGSE